MKVLTVELGQSRSYPIYIGSGLLQDSTIWTQHIGSKQVLIVSNTTIAPLYLPILLPALQDYQVETVILPDGEQYKNLAHLEQIFDQLLAKKFSRNATLIALGGGVIINDSYATDAESQPAINAVLPSFRFRPHYWRRSIPRSAAKLASIIRGVKT